MRAMAAALAFLVAAIPAPAQTAIEDVRDQVSALAFDPVRFFDQPPNALMLRYRGDDRGWPVWSIAVRRMCIFQGAGKPCRQSSIARMVRAPALEGEGGRPRRRGSALIGDVQARVKAGADIPAAIAAAEPEWREADVLACPAALAVLDRVDAVRWVYPAAIGSFDAQGVMPPIMLHADTIEVTIPTYLAYARYSGAIVKETPAGWANEFALALEPCWKDATVAAPWTVPLAPSVAR